jgi:predicted transcriptional regulator
MNFEKESELLKALAHPVRLKLVLGLMKDNDCNVSKIVSELKLPQSTISQHLGILKSKGIIKPKKTGVKTCYQVVSSKAAQIIEILK